MKGHTRKVWRTEAEPQARTRPCDHPACRNEGEYRAPKSRDALNSYYWFCLEHVRAYNAAWDYYAGLTPQEIEEMVRADTTWQRPTWKLGTLGAKPGHGPGIRDPFGVFGEDGWDEAHPHRPQRPHSPEEEAMQVMSLTPPLTFEALKARYKELVKQHHPDLHGGDKAQEERFKLISQAYKTLRNSLNA